MSTQVTDLQQQIAKLSHDAKALHAQMAADATLRTSENNEKLDRIIADGQAKREELTRLKKLDELSQFTGEPEEKGLPLAGDEGYQPEAKRLSWGQQITETEEWKLAAKNGFRGHGMEPIEIKALYEGTAASGGAAVFSDRRPGITDLVKTAPTTLLDIMNVSGTTSNSIDYIRTTGFTNSAAEVNEWSSGNFGLKPESNMTFELVNSPVQTIAHWIAVSRNLMSDAPAAINIANTKLRAGLERRLEGQVIAGNGTAPNLRGIINTLGIQTRSGAAGSASPRYTAGDTRLDTIRKAITDVQLGFGQANAIVLHPGDAEALELQKDDNNNYMNVYDPVRQRVWRVQVVENMAMTLNRGLVGDFANGAILYIRENIVIRTAEQHADFFVRNAIVLLAEMRAALAVLDPEMFVDVNTLS